MAKIESQLVLGRRHYIADGQRLLSGGRGDRTWLLIDKVRDCSFRLHTLLFSFPTHLGPSDLYLDSHRTIANTHGSPLHCRNNDGRAVSVHV